MDLTALYVYDIETFKEAFTFSVVRADGAHCKTFQVTKFKNELDRIYKCLDYLEAGEFSMVGFNNLGFDYPIIHEVMKNRKKLLKMTGAEVAVFVWELAQKQIDSFKGAGFGNTVKVQDRIIPQIDLYKVNHMDNKAKATSLKMLEFNMLMKNIEDLPYAVEAELTEEMIDKIVKYNEHDTEATRLFLLKCTSQIDFRINLTQKYGKDFINHNDAKIGSDYFQMRLEECGIKLYDVDHKGRKSIRQSKRIKIKLKDCLFDYYDFKRPECIAVFNWFKEQSIRETKGVFSDIDESDLGDVAKYAELVEKRKKFKGKPTQQELDQFRLIHPKGWIVEQELKGTETIIQPDGTKLKVPKKSYWMHWREAETLNIQMGGLRIDFGTGGIHASLIDKIVRETDKYLIRDADCSSMYPNIAISNSVYPEHLGVEFCDIYKDLYEQRKSYPKTAPENGMLKLALNATYGNSNNQFSVFYDPQYTMKTTLNGQLSLLLLAEKLLEIPDLKLVQLNTDGMTVALRRDTEDEYKEICSNWEKQVGLQLEYNDYSKMFIRDVNSYCAIYTNGKVKYKGAYVYKREELGWHQNHSALVIPMAAVEHMINGTPIEEFIKNHKEKFDFMLRTKVPRSSRLIMAMEDGTEIPQQNICRYYPSKKGGKLIKIMPPLPGKEDAEERRLGIDVQWNVKTCNDVDNFSFDDVDFDYYVSEAEKLLVGVGNTAPINRDEEGE